jgi:hypothetical protein
VDLIDDVELKFPACRGVFNVIDDDLADFVDLSVGGGIEFQHVETVATGNFTARITLATGVDGGALHTVERLGHDAGRGGFACATGPYKDVGVGQALLCDGVFERGGDVLLTNDVIEGLGAIFAGENRVAHS